MQKQTVLVIDDDEATRRLLDVSPTLDGFEVGQCVDGITGLEAALSIIPDVVLLDIQMPGMDGWEVLSRLRADPRGQNIPVLVITAHDTAESQTNPVAAQTDGLFGKPFRLPHLRARIAALAANGRNLAA